MGFVETKSKVAKAGDVYGSYTVQGIFNKLGKYPKYALVTCACGSRERYVSLHCLRSGEATSCGCHQKRMVTKHGLYKDPVYRCWTHMMSRCYDPKNKRYSRYGARGITVCERWRDLGTFVSDMAPSFLPGLTIERIDNDRSYEPDNCRWATRAEQTRNYSRNVMIEYDGVSLCLKEWSEKLKINYGTLWDRHKQGWSVERMLTTPVMS